MFNFVTIALLQLSIEVEFFTFSVKNNIGWPKTMKTDLYVKFPTEKNVKIFF